MVSRSRLVMTPELARASAGLITAAAVPNEPKKLSSALKSFEAALRNSPRTIKGADAREVLEALRNRAHFDSLIAACQAIIMDGCWEPSIYRLYAQALIELGQLPAAVELISNRLKVGKIDKKETGQLQGLLGCALKQSFINTNPARKQLRKVLLERSLLAYGKALLTAAEGDRRWVQINLAALLSIQAAGGKNTQNMLRKAQRHARDVIRAVEDIPDSRKSAWDYASAAEASIALQNWDGAAKWLRQYLSAPDKDAFKLRGTLRQFQEVWQLHEKGPQAAELIPPLSAAVLEATGGALDLTLAELSATKQLSTEASYERVFGAHGARVFSWYMMGLQRARSVALIKDGLRGIGTGFLVDAEALLPDFFAARPDLRGKRVLITNAHVVSEPRYLDAIVQTMQL